MRHTCLSSQTIAPTTVGTITTVQPTVTKSCGNLHRPIPGGFSSPLPDLPPKPHRREPSPDLDSISSESSHDSPPKSNPKPGVDRPRIKNVVLFGETGVGKSSVINMIREGITTALDDQGASSTHGEALVSSRAVGCTFSSQGYPAVLDGEEYLFWDTAGLNEGQRGSVNHEQSTSNLASLLKGLEGGIHLLVYCIRGRRFRQVVKDNYDLFFKIVCQGNVPIVLVVTGLECEEPTMESWWEKNQREFKKYGLWFDEQACITATRGKALKEGGFQFDEEYEESREKVRDVIKKYAAATGYEVVRRTTSNSIGLRDAVEVSTSDSHMNGHLGTYSGKDELELAAEEISYYTNVLVQQIKRFLRCLR
ncbi:hypothetical protein CC1G_02636 [Coprinopsis cinerea okayama7|uniref:G domain-containing protein n=1 Tax=Coprinopsis cinerea (strain Okayama-7 / 130 / ATCC MYA-4618 / FGSC 9003) TaxID=240176 RepID=A8PBF9_COPC7|nr:hypothetical protein CC1G_02636 [Coprinopsis cinerea okayama7\|eukprot:XP_001840173.2 hypothetical protein CC1G_02636 [Coprinopsis cinerea okayama7\